MSEWSERIYSNGAALLLPIPREPEPVQVEVQTAPLFFPSRPSHDPLAWLDTAARSVGYKSYKDASDQLRAAGR